MQISINSISDKKYFHNFYKKQPKEYRNPKFGSNKIVQNQIKSERYQYLYGMNFDKTKLITANEIKELIKNCKDKISNFENLKTEYGQEIGEKLFNALQYQNNEFFVGNNPNAKIEDYDTYFQQWTTYSEEEKWNLITRYANLNNGKYLDFWRNNPEKLVMSVNNNAYLPSQLKNFNSETWSTILDSYINVFNNNDKVSIIDAMLKYSTDAFFPRINFLPQINKLFDNLIAKVENKQISYSIFQKEMNNLYNLLKASRIKLCEDYDEDTKFKNQIKNYAKNNPFEDDSAKLIANNLRNLQAIINKLCNYDEIKVLIENLKKASITSTEKGAKIPLMRNDGISFFNSLNTDEINLIDLMSNGYFGNIASKQKVLEFFNNKKPEINRTTFLSTAIKPYQFSHTPVIWNLTLGKGVNYLYLSQIVDQLKSHTKSTEAELLVNPCSLKINSAKYDTDNVLVLDADVLPLNENLSKESLI